MHITDHISTMYIHLCFWFLLRKKKGLCYKISHANFNGERNKTAWHLLNIMLTKLLIRLRWWSGHICGDKEMWLKISTTWAPGNWKIFKTIVWFRLCVWLALVWTTQYHLQLKSENFLSSISKNEARKCYTRNESYFVELSTENIYKWSDLQCFIFCQH